MNELEITDIGDNLRGNRLILNGQELEGIVSYDLNAGVGEVTRLTLELIIDNVVSAAQVESSSSSSSTSSSSSFLDWNDDPNYYEISSSSSYDPGFEIEIPKPKEVSRADLLDI